MNNNDILRRLRYAFDFSDKRAIELFTLDPMNGVKLSKAEFAARLLKDEEDGVTICSDAELAAFLDGLIVAKRGLKEASPSPQSPWKTAKTPAASEVEFRLSRNDILKKLRIAMNFREQQMLDTLEQGGSVLSKSELGALFRKPGHNHYRACGNQVLRNFIKGLTLQFRDPKDQEASEAPAD